MPHSKIKRRLNKFRNFIFHNKGVTAIEMALIAPFLFLLSIGAIEIGMVIFVNVVIEGATTAAARDAKTGAFAGLSREDFIRDRILELSVGLMDPDNVQFTITAFDDTNPGVGNPGSAGGAGDLVVMTVEYPWDIITPMASHVFPDPYPITSQATFRNEPF